MFKILPTYFITEDLIKEASDYATLSASYTSNRHDFHSGGVNNKRKKMFEGKLGEKVFKMLLNDNHVLYTEDHSNYDVEDSYDFILPNHLTIDVKTRTKPFHTRTLEMVEQFKKNPKDIYVSVRLFPENNSGQILGWVGRKDIQRINRIENNGYLDNYTIFDHELRNIESLLRYFYSNDLIQR